MEIEKKVIRDVGIATKFRPNESFIDLNCNFDCESLFNQLDSRSM